MKKLEKSVINLSINQLIREIQINQENYQKIKLNHYIKPQKNFMKIKILRRKIAKLKTDLNKKLVLNKKTK